MATCRISKAFRKKVCANCRTSCIKILQNYCWTTLKLHVIAAQVWTQAFVIQRPSNTEHINKNNTEHRLDKSLHSKILSASIPWDNRNYTMTKPSMTLLRKQFCPSWAFTHSINPPKKHKYYLQQSTFITETAKTVWVKKNKVQTLISSLVVSRWCTNSVIRCSSFFLRTGGCSCSTESANTFKVSSTWRRTPAKEEKLLSESRIFGFSRRTSRDKLRASMQAKQRTQRESWWVYSKFSIRVRATDRLTKTTGHRILTQIIPISVLLNQVWAVFTSAAQPTFQRSSALSDAILCRLQRFLDTFRPRYLGRQYHDLSLVVVHPIHVLHPVHGFLPKH